MNTNSIIGGSDGPTSIFVAGKMGADWINLFGLVIIVLLLIPNIIYAMKYKGVSNKCNNRALNLIEQIGRYASMFLMIFNIGIAEFGFSSVEAFIVYAIGNIVLIAAYWMVWLMFFIQPGFARSMALAIIPTVIFLLNGITLMHLFLIGSSIIFGIGHIYVTYQNAKEWKK